MIEIHSPSRILSVLVVACLIIHSYKLVTPLHWPFSRNILIIDRKFQIYSGNWTWLLKGESSKFLIIDFP